MTTTQRSVRDERLSELVTQLSGAPLDRSRRAIADTAPQSGSELDCLSAVAGALVQVLTLD